LFSRWTNFSYGKELDIGSGVLIEKVDRFCHLGDMLNADGGCGSAITA